MYPLQEKFPLRPLCLSLALATLRALWPWQPLDAGSFTSYYSPANALRIVKGALWFAPAVLAFHDLSTAHAIRWSLYAALSNLGAMALYGLAEEYGVPVLIHFQHGTYNLGFLALRRSDDSLRAQHETEERLQLALAATDAVGTWDWDIGEDRFIADAHFAQLLQ